MNRLLNEIVESSNKADNLGLENSAETQRDEIGENDIEWEDLVCCEGTGEKEWVFVEKPFEL